LSGCATNSISPSGDAKVHYEEQSFSDLKNWDKENQLKSFQAFKKSCSKKTAETGNDWVKICTKALNVSITDSKQARSFFEDNFTPYQIIYNNNDTGIYTGYYEPTMKGSLVETKTYNVPIYKTPKDLVKGTGDNLGRYGRYVDDKFTQYYTRSQLSQDSLFNKKDVLVWVKSKVDRSFLQIQGSGRIQTNSGDVILGYDSQNGHPYKPIGKYLLEHKYIKLEDMSMQSIKIWLKHNNEKVDDVLNYDPSYVFFRYINAKNAIGAEGVELTPGYSLAIDNDFYKYGIPMWIETDYDDGKSKNKVKLDRLMIAQDTGGAIRGGIRGDVFWGHGAQAAQNAGHMNNKGKMWVLVPNYMEV
jgi:membrane-bound lytic murein transglycosylase A